MRSLEPNMTSYEDTYSSFKWNVPEVYNFVLDDFEKWAQDRTKIALITVSSDGKTAEKLSFWELSRLSNRFANLLIQKGIKKGDRVFLMLPRSVEWYVAMLGMMKAGIIAMPTPTLSTGHDIDYRINSAEAVAAITDAAGAEKVDAVNSKIINMRHRIIVGHERRGWQNYDALMATANPNFTPEVVGGKTLSSDPMLIYFTSGTTGNPKMVRHTQAYALGHYVTAKFCQDLKPTDIIWVNSDTGWAKTAWGKLFGQWIVGATVMQWKVPTRFEPRLVPEMIERWGVTVFCAPPTVFRMMVAQLDLKQYDLSGLRHVLAAGEPLNPEVIRQWKDAVGFPIYDYYGQTETVAIVGNYRCMPIKEGSMGKPTPGHIIAIVDDNGNELPDGEEGNIAVKIKPHHPPSIFHGYWKDEHNYAFVGDWYFTGDKAYKDKDGYLWFVGRADDVIKASGYRIGPFEVESALQEHQSVQECAVIGIPDEVRGQVVKAFIVLRPGFEPSPELVHELQEHVKIVTAPYKYPREIQFVSELPKTISGKVRRVELRNMEAEKRKK